MKCTKAVIALAGYGGRRAPITKALEKCMMPVGNRPIVDYIVDDCIAAGITDIIFVVGEQSQQIRTYYGHNQKMEAYLAKHHAGDTLRTITDLATKARFHFIVQDSTQPYGTTVPVWLARDHIKPHESFLFLYGDNIFYREDGGSAIADFLQEAEAIGATDAMMGVPVPKEEIDRYGIIATKKQHGAEYFSYIVEKPSLADAPSDLNNAGCFLLRHNILEMVERGMSHPTKEQFFTDPLNWYSEAGNDIAVIRCTGEYHDCGTLEGWLKANNRMVKL